MRTLVFLTIFCLAGAGYAETVFIPASKDNTIYEDAEGALSNGAGEYLIVGNSESGAHRHALIAFTDLSAIPDGARIHSVKLHLSLSSKNGSEGRIWLFRVHKDWGEGASNASGGEYDGAPAAPGDATWIYTHFGEEETWGYAGGATAYFSSADLYVTNPGPYVFGPTDSMIHDVENWKAQSAGNFGWMIRGHTQNPNPQLQFRSRENFESPPMLEVTYSTTGTEFDFSGIWYDPSLDGEGYNVFQTPAGWVIYYFGYTTHGQFLWVTSELVQLERLELGVPFELPMLVGAPGTFNSPSPSSLLEPYGILEVIFDSCTRGEFTLEGLDGVKVSNVVRLAGVDGASCLEL